MNSQHQPKIVIHTYKPSWPQEFEVIKNSLSTILDSLAIQIDHIGSTSVPGLGAKNIIDIQVTVEALTPEVPEKLIAAGYHYYPDITHDHVPLGADKDPNLWKKQLFRTPPNQRQANIHVRVFNNLNQQYALLFRDYLRSHPNSAKSVELIKRQLAKYHGNDIDAYYDIKDPVYDLLWEAALEWATYTN
ncbi:MAG: GrpB family protein [Leptolyngbya sp. SIO3F4]|nr:GrpB family protein [Leptolyngbya sp. SIO3F4]